MGGTRVCQASYPCRQFAPRRSRATPRLDSRGGCPHMRTFFDSLLGWRAVFKSSCVCAQNSCGVRSRWRAASLPAKVARQLLHAQLHQCQRFRRHSSHRRRTDRDRVERAPGPTQGRYAGLVPAEGLPAQRRAFVSGGELKTASHYSRNRREQERHRETRNSMF